MFAAYPETTVLLHGFPWLAGSSIPILSYFAASLAGLHHPRLNLHPMTWCYRGQNSDSFKCFYDNVIVSMTVMIKDHEKNDLELQIKGEKKRYPKPLKISCV